MDITVQKAMSACRNLEPQLTTQLAASNVSYAQLEDTLNQICVACSTALLQDFETASNQHAEERIWDSHQKVHQYYRSALAKLKSSKEPSTVARRKLEGCYLRFIKSAQRFYRGYIRNLSATHGGIPELERVARKVSSDGQADTRRNAAKAPRNKILRSCHTTLIYLGDLSRYRETELPGKERNWGPAVGFYDLATSILPSSGLSYNQLAVIALLDGSLFRATYQLWRSLSTEEPHPQADQNLERASKKVNTAWKDADLKDNPSMTAGAGLPRSMVACYLRLISQTYLGRSFVGREELENEVVNQLAVDLRKQSPESSPHKLVIINIAAGHREQENLEKSVVGAAVLEQCQFFRLNMRTFITLISIFREHISGLGNTSDSADDASPKSMAKRLTPSIMRLLPALHLYSLWLHKNTAVLSKSLDNSLTALRTELWATYAECLTSVTQVFPPENLQTVKHLLEEEEDTIGFKPLHCPDNRETWYSGDGLKSRWHDLSDHAREIDMEMLSRLTSFMIVGVKLAVSPETPIVLDEVTCNFNYGGKSLSTTEVPLAGHETAATESAASSPSRVGFEESQMPGRFSPEADAEDLEAQRMVDSIVGPDDFLDETSPAPQNWHRMNNGGGGSPRPTNLNSSILGSSSMFPVGTHTANDLLEAVQNYSQNQRNHATPIPAFPGLGIRTSSSSTLLSPGLQNQPLLSPGHPNNISEHVRTPQAGSLSRPGTGARTSPLAAPPGLGHSRINSNDSASSSWVPNDTWSPYQPSDNTVSTNSRAQRRSLYNDRALGNGTFGDLVYRRVSNHDIKADAATSSPSLVGTEHDAWRRGSGGFARAVSHYSGNMQVDANLSTTNSPASRNMPFEFPTFSRPLT